MLLSHFGIDFALVASLSLLSSAFAQSQSCLMVVDAKATLQRMRAAV